MILEVDNSTTNIFDKMGNLIVKEVSVPHQEMSYLDHSSKPTSSKRTKRFVEGYNKNYHSAKLFHIDGEIEHSSTTEKVIRLDQTYYNKIPDIIQMAHDFGLLLHFVQTESGCVDVFVLMPERPSVLCCTLSIAKYAETLIYQTVRGLLFKLK